MATLRDLLRAVLPLARLAGGEELGPDWAEREVTWVRVLRPRVPAFEALEAGVLAIIPAPALAIVAPNDHDIAEVAAALARARVSAALIVEGDGGEDGVATLTQAATEAGVTVLHAGREDPAVLERTIIGFLVDRRSEIDRRAAELEGQVTHLALLGRGLDVLAAAIGESLGRAVAIEGRRGDVIAIHAPTDLPEAAAAVSRYLARPANAAYRVEIPAPANQPGTGGRLALLGDDPASELERIAAGRVATVLALELARNAAVSHAREETRRGDPLPADGPPWVVILARQAAEDRPDDIAAREETRAELRLLVSPRRLTLRGTSESLEVRLVAAAPADDPEGLLTAGRIASFLSRGVAVSEPFAEPAARPLAEASARATLAAAEALDQPPAVARASRLPAYQLLGTIRNLPDGFRQARELLAPILVGRDGVQQERLRTLQAVLEAGSLGEAAARLGVHRNTVAYRVGRLEELGGWDLSDPDLRFALSVATRILRKEGHGAAPMA
ncbi:MAG TPA: helix-turn-helix domain-containing protein [Candidatus Limnocylindrales bacterium]|nr:helix-turn-helix domain-containing protein [Candidatus Limnocylindrales bacterium]